MRVPIVCCLLAFPVLAQFAPDQMLQPYAYTNEAGEVFMCRLSVPHYPEAGKKYPLILFLHGSGECGTNNISQIKAGVPSLLKSLLKQPEPVMILAPQCPPGMENWWVTKIARTADYAAAKEPSPSLEVALELCRHLVETKQADPDRLYITGLSLGGFGTWDAIQRNPEMFAAAVPICGGGDVRQMRNIKSMPIWVFHAVDDKNVSVECSRRLVRQLKALGAKRVNYTEYEQGDHGCWDRAYSDAKMIAWLLKQKRSETSWWKFWTWF